MSLKSLTGKPTYYPNLKETEPGTVIFEKAKFVKSEPSRNYPNSTTWLFEVEEPIETERGTFTRVGVSAGQITKAMEGLIPEGGSDSDIVGEEFRLVYEGSNVLTQGSFKGKSAHAFSLQQWGSEDSQEDTNVSVDKAAAAQARVNESKQGGDTLDNLMDS